MTPTLRDGELDPDDQDPSDIIPVHLFLLEVEWWLQARERGDDGE